MTKRTGYSEVDAMREVDEALGKLEADEQNRVIEWLASKYRVRVKPEFDGSQAESAQLWGTTGRPPQIKDFLAQKQPASFYERVACLAYHLEKFQEKADVDNKDIVEANTQARLSRLSNAAVFIKHATHTYGYLTSLGKRKFAISRRGEAVVEALPDRAKVDEAHIKFPFGKKAKKRTRSKE
jgi:hypothetical protein